LIRSAILDAFAAITWPDGVDFCVMGSGRGANHVLFQNFTPGTTVWNVDLSGQDMCRTRAINIDSEIQHRFVQMDAKLFIPPPGAVLLYVLSLYQIGASPQANGHHPLFVVTHEVDRIIKEATLGEHFYICGAAGIGTFREGARWSLGGQVHLAFDAVEGPRLSGKGPQSVHVRNTKVNT
jgi:hypothetical protein